MQYLCEVVAHSPLTLRFSFLNPPDSTVAVNVPRAIGPYGLFLRVTIKDNAGRVVTEPPSLRATHKLPADSGASYLELQPGYSFGATFVIDDAPTSPGAYRMTV